MPELFQSYKTKRYYYTMDVILSVMFGKIINNDYKARVLRLVRYYTGDNTITETELKHAMKFCSKRLKAGPASHVIQFKPNFLGFAEAMKKLHDKKAQEAKISAFVDCIGPKGISLKPLPQVHQQEWKASKK